MIQEGVCAWLQRGYRMESLADDTVKYLDYGGGHEQLVTHMIASNYTHIHTHTFVHV